ncbi:MAG: zinc-ribbon domain-containing protein [Deltaproteobacteria bacterium]|nr:zinc-ribbon domain-containing protein [Deltaproteobacteria bacterium]MBN2845819.1 zinc-ribbon domain-containing protein [Deltaproteobacteria bacterium]
MIIQCERCETKYNFDESTIEGEGFWVRCTRCENVFFQENPSADSTSPPVGLVEPEEEEDEQILDDLSVIIDEIQKGGEGKISEKIEDIYAPEERDEPPEEKITLKKKKVLWSPPELVAYLIVVILVVGGVYMWLFPDFRMRVVDRIKTLPVFERIVGTDEESQGVDVEKSAVEITDIEEKYIENWVIGNLLVVEGIAVNNNDYSVSKIRVRGKVLNGSGDSIMEVESYCGTIISDEELSNLTEIEIRQELSNPYGSGFPNKDIPYGGKIPFMLVFTNPAEGASEFTVELAGVEEEKW